jgi:hypothetical protein
MPPTGFGSTLFVAAAYPTTLTWSEDNQQWEKAGQGDHYWVASINESAQPVLVLTFPDGSIDRFIFVPNDSVVPNTFAAAQLAHYDSNGVLQGNATTIDQLVLWRSGIYSFPSYPNPPGGMNSAFKDPAGNVVRWVPSVGPGNVGIFYFGINLGAPYTLGEVFFAQSYWSYHNDEGGIGPYLEWVMEKDVVTDADTGDNEQVWWVDVYYRITDRNTLELVVDNPNFPIDNSGTQPFDLPLTINTNTENVRSQVDPNENAADDSEFTAKRGFAHQTGFKPQQGHRRRYGFLKKFGF